MGGSGPGTEPAAGAGTAGHRLRAAVAGTVTFAVIVTGGLVVRAGDAPRSVAEHSATPADSPSPSLSPQPERLGQPTHLRVERGVTSVSLAWDPPAGIEPPAVDHYEVFRDGKRIGRPTRTRYDARGLTFGTSYRFWVVAVGTDDRASPRVLRSITTRVPPVAASRLSGTYTATATLVSSDGQWVRFFPSHSITWSLVPQCSATACNVAFTGTHRFGPRTVVTSGVLDWSGRTTYTGRWVGSFGAECRNDKLEAISTLTITMRATEARVVGGLWVASGVAGSIHQQVAGCAGTPSAQYTF